MRKPWKLPSFLVAMATGISVWLYLVQQSAEILSQPPSDAANLHNQQLPKKLDQANQTNKKSKILQAFHPIKEVQSYRPEEHGKVVARNLDIALQENELLSKKFKFESVLHQQNVNLKSVLVSEDKHEDRNTEQKRADISDFNYVPFVESLSSVGLKAILSPADSTCEDYTIVLIAVSSSVESFHYRQAIRETWGTAHHNSKLSVKVIFNLGKPLDKWKHLQQEIEEEARIYQDILQWNFYDHYSNLTLKTLGLFQWVKSQCSHSKFIMKTDDDVFLNIPNFLQLLISIMHDNQDVSMMLGYLIEGAKPGQDRNSKWYTSDSVYRDKVYPPYLSGSAYVISMDLIGPLYEQALKTPPFWLEDIYITGVLKFGTGAALLHNAGFWYRKRKGGLCEYRVAITGHELTADDLYKIWNDLQRSDSDCMDQTWHFARH